MSAPRTARPPFWLDTRRNLVTLPRDCTWIIEAWGALYDLQRDFAAVKRLADAYLLEKWVGGAI